MDNKKQSHNDRPLKRGELSQSEEEIIYSALGSQIRRDIISFIKQNEKVGFVDLRENFDLKVGSLYHQLNSMKELLVQDDEKKYFLSELGKVAYELMILNKDYISSSYLPETAVAMKKQSKYIRSIINGFIFAFLPRKLFKYLASEPLRSFFESLIILGGMIYFAIDSAKVLVGFYPITVTGWYYSLLGVIGLWLFLGLVVSLLKTIFYRRKYNPLKLLAITPFALIPNLIVLFLLWLQTKVSTTFLYLEGQVLIIFSQIWSLSLMTTATSQAEDLTMNRSSLIVLFTFYITYAISFLFAS
jgi:hypothetical protein